MSDRTHAWTRREWLRLTAAGAIGAGAACRSESSQPPASSQPPSSAAPASQAAQPSSSQLPRRYGVQLYTVRDLLPKRTAETLKAIASIGYTEVELFQRDRLATQVPLARDVGLTPICTHIEAALVRTRSGEDAPADAMSRAFDEIRQLGLTAAIVAYLDKPDRPKDVAGWQRFAEQMNRAGEAASRAGVSLGYHNHGFEFETLAGGRRPIDVLIETCDPKQVAFELDVFWVSITGNDPAALIEQLGSRVTMLHLKDKAKDTPVETDDSKVAEGATVEVGAGAVDFPAVLRAGAAAGVQHYFVEQDHTPGEPIASLEKSYKYLSALAQK